MNYLKVEALKKTLIVLFSDVLPLRDISTQRMAEALISSEGLNGEEFDFHVFLSGCLQLLVPS